MEQARRGDQGAFKEIVIKYEKQIAATIIGMLGRCPEADDIGQETFIRFYNAMDQFRGDSKVGTYLTRIAINLSLNEIKRRRRKEIFFPKTVEDIANHACHSPDMDSVDMSGFVQKALQALEPDFRSVLVLRLLDGYSTKETAEILNIPEGTVLSRLSRAQKKFKVVLAPFIGEKIHG